MPVINRETLAHRYRAVRCRTEQLCEPLDTEDYVVQSMPDASPTKWHIAHTSWFFETFLLKPNLPGYQSPHPQYDFLFNSYYNAVGERHCRAQRGMISRPTVAETFDYRAHVDGSMLRLLEALPPEKLDELAPLLTLGLHHEQQHQELMLTDVKHMLSMNPLLPAYRKDASPSPPHDTAPLQWKSFDEGVYWIGYREGDAEDGFFFDNEGPRHRQFLHPFALASRLVTNGEYRRFMDDGGYRRPEFWLSAGWATVQATHWEAPFYWERQGSEWQTFSLAGLQPVKDAEPVCHLSYFEANAYARWASQEFEGARLPTEAEWEVAAAGVPIQGNFVDGGVLHPQPVIFGQLTSERTLVEQDFSAGTNSAAEPTLHQMYGDVWEWTQSQYSPYPGYVPAAGAIGEYNGKFMCNQFVLRGGSCATSQNHIRATYRNFFPPDARWQFTGLRLARDIGIEIF